MSRARRWIAGIAVLGLLVAVPVALAVGPFGSVEQTDPEKWVGFIIPDSPQLAAGGNGDAVWGSGADVPGGVQMAVYERCGSSPVTWRRTLLGTADSDLRPWGVAMNSAGVALAVWRVPATGSNVTFLSSVRPAGGTWGPPQEIVTAEVGALEFAIGGNGAALAAWNQSNPTGVHAAVRPAGGDWSDQKTLVAANQTVRAAMSEAGDAVVLSFAAPAREEAYYRPAGGQWGSSEKLVDLPFTVSPGLNQFVEFDGDGRAVAVYGQQGVLRASERSGGQWSQTPTILDQATGVGISRLARLPHGVAALWGRGSNANEIVVSRLGGSWETKHVYSAARFARMSIGADATGRVLLAATVLSGTGFHNEQIDGAVVSLGDSWPGTLEHLSPAPGDPGPLYRDPLAAGGGNALFLGWGVHGTNQPHSEAIATAPPPLSCEGTLAATATATATATLQPQPLPQPQPKPQPKLPKAVGGFVALPKANHCLRTSKLTFRVKRPKGFIVKQIVVKLNGRRVKLVKGRALLHAIALRHLPRRSFTVAVDVKLSDGRILHGKRHYKRCA